MQNMNSMLVPAGLSPGNRSNDGSLPTLQFELAGGGCTQQRRHKDYTHGASAATFIARDAGSLMSLTSANKMPSTTLLITSIPPRCFLRTSLSEN